MRSIYVRGLVFSVVAASLSGCFFNGNGQLQGEARDNGNGNASNDGNGNASNDGNGNASNDGNENSGASNGTDDTKAVSLDGTWDVTTSGRGSITPSEMAIHGSRATGFIPLSLEGQGDHYYGCTRSKDRYEFDLTATGDAMNGTFTHVQSWTGNDCPASKREPMLVTGARTEPGKSALDGDWAISATGAESLSETLHISSATGAITAVASRPALSFSARKR